MTNNTMFKTKFNIQELDSSNIEQARELFCGYQEKKIILNNSWNDKAWKLSDEYSHIGISFNVNELLYRKNFQIFIKLSYPEFIDYLKTFTVLQLGKYALDSIRNIINSIKKVITWDIQSDSVLAGTETLDFYVAIIDFFSYLPHIYDEDMMDKLLDIIGCCGELKYMEQSDTKRKLPDFNTFFLFDEILNNFWEHETDKETRLFYYPIYLWWQISAIIPLRPREFILTPKNCLEEKNDGYYITLRRNQLKGSDKSVGYNINSDYVLVQYKITDKLANTIKNYISETSATEMNEIDTFLLTGTHYKKWNIPRKKNSRYFTYVNMNCVLRYFYSEIIVGKYGLSVVYDNNIPLNNNEIHYIHLGDTRHISLINIIAEGGTPVTAMLLAGHDNINMASHYYTNITSLIECKTYQQYRNYLNNNAIYTFSESNTVKYNIDEYVEIENGRCYSSKFIQNDVNDCLNNISENGEIGSCKNCIYYRQENKVISFEDENYHKKQIQKDCKHLSIIVQQYRSGIGYEEDIQQALRLLQSSTLSYKQYLLEKYNNTEE